jgi:uncharacterized MAPEG superfamily protein
MASSPIFWVIVGVAVLALLWLLFSMMATSKEGRESDDSPADGPADRSGDQR